MRFAEFQKSRRLLIGDVDASLFDPCKTWRSMRVGIFIDASRLRVVPVIATTTTSTAPACDAAVREAIIRAASQIVPAFGKISSFALIEPGSRGHVLTPWHVDGHAGRSREVTWLGEVMLTFLKTDERFPSRLLPKLGSGRR